MKINKKTKKKLLNSSESFKVPKVPKVPSDLLAAGSLKEEIARINLNVTSNVRKEWKKAAINSDQTLTDLIVKAMSKYLKNK